MNPGEAERKLLALEEKYAALESELATYREFFEASLAMNQKAASLPEAQRVHDVTTKIVFERMRHKAMDGEPSALESLKRASS